MVFDDLETQFHSFEAYKVITFIISGVTFYHINVFMYVLRTHKYFFKCKSKSVRSKLS